MVRPAITRILLLASSLAGATACLDSSGLRDTSERNASFDTLPGLIVSQPLTGSAASGSARALAAGSAAASGAVFVSLVPGTVPDGLQATIRDVASGVSVTTVVVAGGFDPVAMAANVGDTLALEITRLGPAQPLRAVQLVRAHRPPVVVRTEPPPGRRDVPLNAAIVVVFSDPIDAATLTTQAIQVWRGTTLVAGTVQVSDSAGIRAEFHPDSLLAGQTDYRLVVTQAIRDVNGLALDPAVEVPFTTGTTVAPAAVALTFEYDMPNAIAGLSMWGEVLVRAIDAQGNLAAGFSGTVTIGIGENPGGGALSGTRSASAVSGEAAFVDLRIDRPGSGYALVASAPGLGSGTSTAFDVEPTIGPTTNLIAFTTGTWETAFVDPYGGGIATLHVNGRNPVWSPDGAKIAFSPGPAPAGSGWWLGIMNADGSGAHYVPDIGECPAWSPNGTKIAVYKYRPSLGGYDGIYVMNPDGSGLSKLIGIASTCPVWSPDGAKIAFDSTTWASGFSHIYVMNADGRGVRQLTSDSLPAYGAAWSPDGRRIAFVGGGLAAAVYVMNSDGSGVTPLSTGIAGASGAFAPIWSPDGRLAFITSLVGISGDIYVTNADGSGVVRLTTGAFALGASWSPDGRRITFYGATLSEHTWSPDQTYVVNDDGSGLTAVTPVHRAPWSDSEWPAWRPRARP